jgi:hypothetical protein
MTTAPVSPREPRQTDLIRYFDRNLLTAPTVTMFDRLAIEARARHDRSAMIGELIGSAVAWLWRRLTHHGETRSPAPRLYVQSRVQF